MLIDLFREHRTLRGVIDSVLEGRLGTSIADDGDSPAVARLDLGCYTVLGGDAANPKAAEMVSTVRAPRELPIPDDGERFVSEGIGFGAVDGDRLVSAASSYAISSRRVEVAVATRPSHERRGLAGAVAARMLLRCREHGLIPEWSASNPVSRRLALAMGYRPGALCDVFDLE